MVKMVARSLTIAHQAHSEARESQIAQPIWLDGSMALFILIHKLRIDMELTALHSIREQFSSGLTAVRRVASVFAPLEAEKSLAE